MKLELNILSELEQQLKEIVVKATIEAKEEEYRRIKSKEWMTLKEGASYAGVSYNTFIKFRVLGLVICEIEGIKRVSKKEIDRFLYKHSF
ncbi:DNA-binding protein [Psychrobacillus psychrotolerans]|uniref:DNA-binding protein n=1 Tax=Psychrobacillus psychrotolerans TaxID=126156 RepID=UPI0033154A8E